MDDGPLLGIIGVMSDESNQYRAGIVIAVLVPYDSLSSSFYYLAAVIV
jgi:hypothetical protein